MNLIVVIIILGTFFPFTEATVGVSMVSNRKTRAREPSNTVVDNGSLGVKKGWETLLKRMEKGFCHHLLKPQVISNLYDFLLLVEH